MANIGLEIKVDSAEVTKNAVQRIIDEWEWEENVSEEYKQGFNDFGNAVMNFLDKYVQEEKDKQAETPTTDDKAYTNIGSGLKRCPYCNGEARRYNGNYDMHGVVCKKCGAKIYGYANQASATRAWNRRVKDEC